MEKGDEIIIPEPFLPTTMISTAGDITVKPITSSIDNGFALPSISELKINYPKHKSNINLQPGNPTAIYILKMN